MRFLAGSSRLATDEKVVCWQQDGRRQGGSPRAIAFQGRPSSFYWQALGLTAGFIVAAVILASSAAHGAERFPAPEDSPSNSAQASERDEPLVREEAGLEVSHASAL